MIRVKSIKIVDADFATRQEVDLDFLGSGFRRKLFVSDDPAFHWRAEPMRARTSLTIVPIPVGQKGFGRIRYDNLDGGLECAEMRIGHYYFIPPNVAYQLETEGAGVLEIYAPKPKSGYWFEQERLPEDYFDQRAAAEQRETKSRP